MKNGLLNVNDNAVLNYNSSDNIEIYNFKLKDYLNLLKKEMENYVINQKSYKIYQLLSNYTINTTNTYEYLNTYTGTFAGRKNSINSVYSLNDDNYITLNENCPRENNYVRIRFDTQFFANGGSGTKYIQIQIIRDGSVLDSVNKSVSTYNTGERAPISLSYGYMGKIGDIIKLGVYGTTNDLVQNSSVEIETQPILRDSFINLL